MPLYRTKSARRLFHEAGTSMDAAAKYLKQSKQENGPHPEPLSNYLDVCAIGREIDNSVIAHKFVYLPGSWYESCCWQFVDFWRELRTCRFNSNLHLADR